MFFFQHGFLLEGFDVFFFGEILAFLVGIGRFFFLQKGTNFTYISRRCRKMQV